MSRMRSNASRIALVAALGLVVGLGAQVASTAPAGATEVAAVHAFGGAPALGAPTTALNAPIVGIAATRSGKGYWLLGRDGGIFSYGTAAFYGSTSGMQLNQPVVGIAPTPSGHGYWLVASDGGIFSFGDAGFHGSTGAMQLNQPIVGMAPTPSGHGYWLVASDGGIFCFGDASYHGSTGGSLLFTSIVGIGEHRERSRLLARGGQRPDLLVRRRQADARGHHVEPDRRRAGHTRRRRTVARRGRRRGLHDRDREVPGGAGGGVDQAVGIARAAAGHGYWVATVPSGPPLPANSGSGRRIVYSNKQQRIWLVEADGIVSHTFLVSGRHGLPAVGTYHVYSKVPSSPSGDLTLPWTLRFAYAPDGNPIDMHGIPLDPNG